MKASMILRYGGPTIGNVVNGEFYIVEYLSDNWMAIVGKQGTAGNVIQYDDVPLDQCTFLQDLLVSKEDWQLIVEMMSSHVAGSFLNTDAEVALLEKIENKGLAI